MVHEVLLPGVGIGQASAAQHGNPGVEPRQVGAERDDEFLALTGVGQQDSPIVPCRQVLREVDVGLARQCRRRRRSLTGRRRVSGSHSSGGTPRGWRRAGRVPTRPTAAWNRWACRKEGIGIRAKPASTHPVAAGCEPWRGPPPEPRSPVTARPAFEQTLGGPGDQAQCHAGGLIVLVCASPRVATSPTIGQLPADQAPTTASCPVVVSARHGSATCQPGSCASERATSTKARLSRERVNSSTNSREPSTCWATRSKSTRDRRPGERARPRPPPSRGPAAHGGGGIRPPPRWCAASLDRPNREDGSQVG